MGSGVLPLAMATRPAKTAVSPGRPALAGRSGGERRPRTRSDPGDLPGLGGASGAPAGRKRVVWVSAVEEGCRPLAWAPGSSPGASFAQPRARGSPGLSVVFAAGCGRVEADRAISTGQLRGLPRFHLRPIDVMVYDGSRTRPGFEEGFPLRCVQRLSRPHLATRRCGWRHNRYTRGASLPVLSY
jgi:hypothetical protein